VILKILRFPINQVGGADVLSRDIYIYIMVIGIISKSRLINTQYMIRYFPASDRQHATAELPIKINK
jgi:hypothetical protein